MFNRCLHLLPYLLTATFSFIVGTAPVDAFCGFYVAKAETDLFNSASKVVIARDGDRTVLTMANDFQGDPREFAMVIPIPTALERDQIHVAERGLIEHLDAYTAPRLVEYHDADPCLEVEYRRLRKESMVMAEASAPGLQRSMADQLGVTIEAEYTVGEYDIMILSAQESTGLEHWLVANGYRLPEGASPILGSYLKQGLRFFVAKVNLEEQAKQGFTYLRPLQIAMETPKFMLPIRLGTLNADGPQELFVFLLNRTGRVETTNYRTVRLPTGTEIPGFVADDFGSFYRDLFARQVTKESMRSVFLEYAWDMSWCDPCAADPLSALQLRQLGVFWSDDSRAAQDVFVTRLHLRYTADSFPEDLRFQDTGDRTNFQGRYVIHRPWQGSPTQCSAAADYFRRLEGRQETWARNLAQLTGRDLAQVRAQAGVGMPGEEGTTSHAVPWWKRLWAGSR